MFAIRRDPIDNCYGEENTVESYILTDDNSLIVKVDVDNILFNINDMEHLRQELLLKYPAPTGFSFLSTDRNVCLSRDTPHYLQGFRILKTMQAETEVTREQLFAACRQYGSVEVDNNIEWLEKERRLSHSQNVVFEGEFVLSRGTLTHNPEKAKQILSRQKRKPLNDMKSGEVSIRELCKIAGGLEEFVYSHHVMLRLDGRRMMSGIYSNSKYGYMARIFHYVRLLHTLYHGRDVWRMKLEEAPHVNWNEKNHLKYNVQRECDVIASVSVLFPYLEGLRKKLKGMKEKLTKADRKYWREYNGWEDNENRERCEAVKKMNEYLSLRNFVIFLEHEQRELK